MMKKLGRLSVLIIALGMLVSGCKESSGENGKEEQVTNGEITEAMEDINNNSVEEIVDSNDTENYVEIDIVDLSNSVKDFSYGKGWYLDNSSGEWNCIDIEGNVLFSLPFGYEPVGGYIQNLCLIQREGYKKIIIDEGGNQVFADMATGDNEILMLSENSGKINIWIRIIKDTYDGHSEILRVIDGEGMTVSEYTSLSGLPFDSINGPNGSQLRDLGEGMYQCGAYIFNTNNNSCFRYEDNAGLIEDVLNFEDGYGIGKDGKIIDSNGAVCFTNSNRAKVGNYREGLYFVGYWEEIFITGKYYGTYRGAFYDVNGQVELDVSQYALENIPFFEEGYCVMNILNEAGVTFTAVMDRNGEFLFEPVEGQRNVEISEEIIVVNGDLIQIYDLKQNTINTLDENIKWVDAFSDGWAVFGLSSGNKGFIDKNGNRLKIKVN